jgi:hypothetical protein
MKINEKKLIAELAAFDIARMFNHDESRFTIEEEDEIRYTDEAQELYNQSYEVFHDLVMESKEDD